MADSSRAYEEEDNHDHTTEATPLLLEEPASEEADHSHAERFVQGLRNVFENTIPNGHHSTPASSPRKIHALLPRLFSLLNSLVDSSSVEDEIVTDDVVEFLVGLGREVVYGLLRCVETFLEEGERDAGRKSLLDRRAEVAQIAAAAVTKALVEKDLMATYCHVLTRPFFAFGEEPNTAESSIEIAIRVHATDFLADVEVQRCVQALWNGLILQTEDENRRVRFVEYSGVRRSRHNLWEWVEVGRLNVPKYQNNIKIAMFIFFLAMYTFVVNNRAENTENPSFVEWVLYVFVLGYVFEEFRLIFEGGTSFFLGSLWHWINIISYIMFMISFGFRFTACFLVDKIETVAMYNDIAYDLLALLAVFLWVKTLSLLDGFKYFGTMVMVLQKMLKDGIMFFWLLAWVYIGFFQSFYALQDDKEKNIYMASMLLVRGFLQDPDFDIAETFHEYYGNWLFALYLFLTSIILLNLLVALFNSSYTNITDSAEKEYLALFTFKVFSYLKSPDQFPYAAPFNLIEVFFVIPWSFVLSKESYHNLNRYVMGGLFGLPILAVARGERNRYLRLRSTNDDDDFEKGRRVYRHLTLEDQDMDELFLLATQGFEDGEDEDVDPDVPVAGHEQAATIAQAEEGVVSASTGDVWKAALTPLESFEEFKIRRAKEKEAKAAAGSTKAVDTSRHHVLEGRGLPEDEERSRTNTEASARTLHAASTSTGQLTEQLVQSLLASLARMELRQKEMEEMLQVRLAKDNELEAIAKAKAVKPSAAVARAVEEEAIEEERREQEEQEQQEDDGEVPRD